MTQATRSGLQTVSRVDRRPDRTVIELANGEQMTLPAFRYVAVGDQIRRRRLLGIELILKAATSPQGRPSWVILAPSYRRTIRLPVPPFDVNVIIRERLSESDWRRAKPLERFHYRGKGLNRVVGRRTVLMAEIEGHGIVAYGVLSSTLPAIAPRMKFFGSLSFEEQYSTGLINRLVRIPRVVVHPEFRNVGLGRLMAAHLVRYVRHWWDIKGWKPIAVEIVAAMTEYHPFFEHAGFVLLGMTHAAGVIMPRYGRGGWAARPRSGEYVFEKPRTPKPYLIRGLSLDVAERIRSAFPEAAPSRDSSDRNVTRRVLASAGNATLRYRIKVQDSRNVQLIREAFGIDQEQLEFPVLKNLSCSLRRGDVMLITGASGSGKSTLLRALGGALNMRGTIELGPGRLSPMSPAEVAWLNLSFSNSRAVIDQFDCDLDEAIAALNAAGLGEAHLYLKPPAFLSDGQRLRLGLALLAVSGKDVWLADDFLVNLDRRTASIVAWGLSRSARRAGKTVVVASPDPAPFLHALLPNVVVELHWASNPRVLRLDARPSMAGRRKTATVGATFASDSCEVWQTGYKVRMIDDVGPLEPGQPHEIAVPSQSWVAIRTSAGPGTLIPPLIRPLQLELADSEKQRERAAG